MTLKELIDRLKQADPEHICAVGFWSPHSYRGDYSQLAFGPKRNARVSDMLACAREALGATYTGWKGGEFTMGEDTEVYLAEHGKCGEGLGPTLLEYMLAPTGSRAHQEQVMLLRAEIQERDRVIKALTDRAQRLEVKCAQALAHIELTKPKRDFINAKKRKRLEERTARKAVREAQRV